jgi:signal transduction histidine kinase
VAGGARDRASLLVDRLELVEPDLVRRYERAADVVDDDDPQAIAATVNRARFEAGKLELNVQDCDVRAIVQDVADLFATASGGHRFAVTLPDEPLPVRCDALRIEQVVTNLVSNAIKYSPDGGTVRVSARAARSRARVARSPGRGALERLGKHPRRRVLRRKRRCERREEQRRT